MATICKLCKKDFKYLSKLKRHRDGEYGCKYIDNNNGSITLVNNNSIILYNISNLPIPIELTTNIELTKNVIPTVEPTVEPTIDLTIEPTVESTIDLTVEPTIIKCKNIENLIINETKSACIKCKKEFTTKYSLARHINENRCRIIKEKIRELAKYNINLKNENKQQLLKVQEDTKEKTKIKKTEIEKLQIQIKLQEKELQALRHKNLLLTTPTKNINLDNKNKIASNFIYLIREREFNENNKEIYKIGKTTQTKLKRINAYPNDSILYLYKECSDCHLSEKEIIKLFKIKYIHKNQIGNEYFEGNREDMMDDICNIIKFKKETIELIL
jgi:hypothetical protein